MLACDATLAEYEALFKRLPYVLASYKYDGIRATIFKGVAYSRSMKPIPNQFIQRTFFATAHKDGCSDLEGYDGELIVGAPCGLGVFARCSSGVMSHAGEPDFTFHCFDRADGRDEPFWERSEDLGERIAEWQEHDDGFGDEIMYPFLRFVRQYKITSLSELLAVETTALDLGYEGLIVRDPQGPYKMGRSTLREGYMLKLKRYIDSEATIIGFEEMMHNTNEAKTDERGYTKRSSAQAGKAPSGMLGALVVRDTGDGREFNVGTGFDHSLRRTIWLNQHEFLGKLIKYRYLPVGQKDLPRHPTFLGIRHKDDT
jgi:DNA ligase-1